VMDHVPSEKSISISICELYVKYLINFYSSVIGVYKLGVVPHVCESFPSLNKGLGIHSRVNTQIEVVKINTFAGETGMETQFVFPPEPLCSISLRLVWLVLRWGRAAPRPSLGQVFAFSFLESQNKQRGRHAAEEAAPFWLWWDCSLCSASLQDSTAMASVLLLQFLRQGPAQHKAT